jgi:hypothetical protein
MRWFAGAILTPITLCLSLGSSGCITRILTDGQIASTRRAALSFDTVGDYDLARAASEASFGQFEGLHALAPYNQDALYLLTKAWAGYGAAFIRDDIEVAQDAGNDDAEDRAKRRARKAFDRAIYYGLQQLGQTSEGFDAAKKDSHTLVNWLAQSFTSKDDAPALLWTGIAWMSRVDVMKGDENEGPALIAELYIGVAMVERAVALDPTCDHYTGLVALAEYHARSGMAEPEEAKQLLDLAFAKTRGKSLMVPLSYATTYACVKSDATLYRDMLNRVLLSRDEDQSLRTLNAIAKHRAERWMTKRRAKDSCGIDLAVATAK